MTASRLLRFAAVYGAILVAISQRRAAGIVVVALMLAPSVIVSLGLSLSLDGKVRPRALVLLATALAPMGATVGVLGWLAPPGSRAAIVCAAGHALVCAVVGLVGVARLLRRRKAWFGPIDELAIDVGHLLLPVGAAWFLAMRAGVPLAGFQEPVVTFTAAHFHYAGFAAPTILGGLGRLILAKADKRLLAVYTVAALVVCAGVPMTAIGIATNHTVEAISAVFLAIGMLCASLLLVRVGARRAFARSRFGGVFLGISGATLLVTMSLAVTFALTSSAGRGSALTGAIPLQTMIDFHGGANAFGFALCGLIGLALARPPPRSTAAPEGE